MKYKGLLLLLCILSSQAFSQSVQELAETARTFTRQRDYANAILVLNRAVSLAPNDHTLQRDLAYNYNLQGDIKKAREIILPLTDKSDADEITFQVAGNIIKSFEDVKEVDKLYKKALKKFPESGPLNSEYGEWLYAKQDFSAIKYWEKGIQSAPSYPMNYYHAAKYYYFTTEKVWGLIYGEIFLNLESFSARTAEIKTMLLEGYKKLFVETDLTKFANKNAFAEAYLSAMQQQTSLVTKGIHPDVLSMIRTRFILQWYHSNEQKFPFRLFDYHRQLLREGLFEAYNQWIFGAADNLDQYQRWTQTHTKEAAEFTKFQRGRVFKMPEGQYYK